MAADESVHDASSDAIRFTLLTNAEAIYGTVLVAGIIAAESIYNASARTVLVSSVAMIIIYFLTHVYAGVTAGSGTESPLWDRIVTESRIESPMLLAVVVPGVTLATASLGRIEAETAISLALWVCVGQLVGAGVLMARRRRMTWWASAASAALYGACGVAVVVLKTFLR